LRAFAIKAGDHYTIKTGIVMTAIFFNLNDKKVISAESLFWILFGLVFE